MSNSFVSILPSTSQQTQMSRHIPWKIWDTRWILFTKVDFGIVLRRLDDYCLIDRVTKDLGIRQLLSYWMTRRWLIFEVWQRIKSLFLRKVKIIKIQNQLEIKKNPHETNILKHFRPSMWPRFHLLYCGTVQCMIPFWTTSTTPKKPKNTFRTLWERI